MYLDPPIRFALFPNVYCGKEMGVVRVASAALVFWFWSSSQVQSDLVIKPIFDLNVLFLHLAYTYTYTYCSIVPNHFIWNKLRTCGICLHNTPKIILIISLNSTSSQDVVNACLVDSRSWISSSSSLAASHEHRLRRSGAGAEAGLE